MHYKNASVFNFINFPDFNGAINSNELEAYLFVYRLVVQSLITINVTTKVNYLN